MVRWGRGGVTSQATGEGELTVATPGPGNVPAPLADTESPTRKPSTRSRWGRRSVHISDEIPQANSPKRERPDVSFDDRFEFGDADEYDEVFTDDSYSTTQLRVTDDDVLCSNCNHRQSVSPIDLELRIPCDVCGKTRSAKAWLWETYPRIELTEPVVYDTPYYLRRLQDLIHFPNVRVDDSVTHSSIPYPPGPTNQGRLPFEGVNCPHGNGQLLETSFLGSRKIVHTLLHENQDGLTWSFGVSKATAAAMTALMLEDLSNQLKYPVYSLGSGLFDDFMCDGISSANQLAKLTRKQMPCKRNNGKRRVSMSPRRNTLSPTPMQSAGEAAAENEEANEENPSTAIQIKSESATLQDSIKLEYDEACVFFRERAENLLKIGCCIPIDFLLKGSDGLIEKQQPIMLKSMSRPLEQRILWGMLEKTMDPAKYIDTHSGLVRSTVDPLSEFSVGPFDEHVVMSISRDNLLDHWTAGIVATVCTTEGPNRRGAIDTFQLDIHINELAFVNHPMLLPNQIHVMNLIQLNKDYRELERRGVAGIERGLPHPLIPPDSERDRDTSSADGGQSLGGGISRISAERKVEDLIHHLITSAMSGVYGPSVQEIAVDVQNRWMQRVVEDGVLGRNTALALQKYLQTHCPAIPDPVMNDYLSDLQQEIDEGGIHADEYMKDDVFATVPPAALLLLRRWVAWRGFDIFNEIERQQAEFVAAHQQQSDSDATPPEFPMSRNIKNNWDLKDWFIKTTKEYLPEDLLNPVDLLTRRALQVVLNSELDIDIATDSFIENETIEALQTFLMNNAESVHTKFELGYHIDLLERSMKDISAEGNVIKQLSEYRKIRETAAAHEIDIIRLMLDEWRSLKSLGSDAIPEGFYFGLVPRYPPPDLSPHHQLHHQDIQGLGSSNLKTKSPKLMTSPDHTDGDVQYRAKIFVRFRGGDGRGRFAAETDWKFISRDFHVRFGALVRLHLSKEPEAILVQIIQRSRIRSTACGHATILPPFGMSPFQPGSAQLNREPVWYQFKQKQSNDSDTVVSGAVSVEAFWSQQTPVLPSKAPKQTDTKGAINMDLEEVTKHVISGRIDPNDPIHQNLMKKLAERYGASLTSVKKKYVPQQQDGNFVSVLLPPPEEKTSRTAISRNTLIKRRWELITNPSNSPTITDRQDSKLVGIDSEPVPQRINISNQKEWLRDTRSDDQPDDSPFSADKDKNVWLAKIRKARAAMKRGPQRDLDILKMVVTQPNECTCFNVLTAIKEFLQPITKLRPYRPLQPTETIVADTDRATVLVYIKSGSNIPVRCREHVLEGSKTIKLAESRGSGFGAVALGLEGSRADGSISPRREDKDDKSSEADIDVFVEVGFGPCQPRRCRSTSGPDPLFGETLKIPIPVEDSSPDTLSLIDDSLKIRVFDVIKQHRPKSDLLRDADGETVNYHEIKRYVGCCELPFHTLINSERATWEGVLELSIPPVSLSYAHQSDLPTEKEASADHKRDDHARYSTLSLYVTLSPPIHSKIKQMIFDPNLTDEPSGVFWYAQRWVSQCKQSVNTLLSGSSEITDRVNNIYSLLQNTEKKSVLCTRFISEGGLQPPQEVFNFFDNELAEQPEFAIARLVSMVPYIEDLSPADSKCQNTCHELLTIGGGDYSDHAVLLCNYFTWLSGPVMQNPIFSRVMVVSGRTDKNMKCAFVFTQSAANQDQINLWDPVTGVRYSVTSKQCPLRSVAMVYNSQELYCNIQVTALPRRMVWDFYSGGWRSFYSPSNRAPVESVQVPLEPFYNIVGEEKEQKLRHLITETVKDTIRALRAPVRTMLTSFRNLLDIHGRKILDHVILPSLEKWNAQGYSLGRGLSDDGSGSWLTEKHEELLNFHKAALREVLSSYEVHGFPINFPWTDVADIRRRVTQTAIHATDPLDKTTEFSVGVYVKGYSSTNRNDFISVWIYLAVLKRNPERWPA